MRADLLVFVCAAAVACSPSFGCGGDEFTPGGGAGGATNTGGSSGGGGDAGSGGMAASGGLAGASGTGAGSGTGGSGGTGGAAGTGAGGTGAGAGTAGSAGGGCKNPITDATKFGFTELVNNKLPSSVEGWAEASCQDPFKYVCPAGYTRTSCIAGGMGTHGGCSSCQMVDVVCKCD